MRELMIACGVVGMLLAGCEDSGTGNATQPGAGDRVKQAEAELKQAATQVGAEAKAAATRAETQIKPALEEAKEKTKEAVHEAAQKVSDMTATQPATMPGN